MYCIFHHFAGLGVSQALYVFSKVGRGLSLGGGGVEKKGFQYPNQSNGSYNFRSFQMRSDHCVCAVFLSK